ncbi:MAG: polysaccharide biosynthesis C-terminal domain-containing protein [Ruminococcus sp.]|nr:polysaccharide biosynthesis C-terminal domain-containing protein [Ruminococcus sp.]
MASAAIAKIFGALFKIPLTNLLGGIGMGYFSCAYGLFLPVYALSVTGLSAAVARTVAQEAAGGCFRNVRRVRRTARILFAGLGALLTVLIWVTARPFALYAAGDEKACYSVMMIAPTALLGCMSAVERGYYEGLQNMYPTALSQAVEAAAKVVIGLTLSSWVLSHEEQVLFYFPAGTDILSVAAAAAVLGVTLSSGAGLLYFLVRNLFGDGLRKKELCSGRTDPFGKIAKELLRVMIPVALGSVAATLTSIIDLCTVMRCFGFAQTHFPEAMERRFGSMAGEESFPAFVYGAFTGMALTVFNLIPSVTNMFGRSALPCAARAWAKGRTEALREQVRSVTLATGLLAIPSGVGLFLLADPIMQVLYSGHTEETVIAAEALRALVPGMVCLCLTTPLFSILQGMGRTDLPVKLMLWGVLVKLLGNLLLIPLPATSISGAGLSTSLCYALMLVLAVRGLRRELSGKLHLLRALWPVLYASCMSGAAAWLLSSVLRSHGLLLQLAGAIAGAVILYFLVLGLMGHSRGNLRDMLSLRI